MHPEKFNRKKYPENQQSHVVYSTSCIGVQNIFYQFHDVILKSETGTAQGSPKGSVIIDRDIAKSRFVVLVAVQVTASGTAMHGVGDGRIG